MPEPVRPGAVVRIPCRSCGKRLIPFTVAAGRHELRCGLCGGTTEVRVSPKADSWLIRTVKKGSDA